MPTPTLEEYLEAIYKLGSVGVVRPTQIAESIGVSGPTVSATLKRLESQGLITRDGTDVVLTEAGLASSVDIVRKHRIAERFLVDILGLDLQAAHDDACLLEHALSARVLSALERLLDNPEFCPHGHPIPSPDGIVSAQEGTLLSEMSPGDEGVVIRVAEEDDYLGYLDSLGLKPGARVGVVDAEPYNGPLVIDVEGERRAVAFDVAARVSLRL